MFSSNTFYTIQQFSASTTSLTIGNPLLRKRSFPITRALVDMAALSVSHSASSKVVKSSLVYV
jgi:hypothetical protein